MKHARLLRLDLPPSALPMTHQSADFSLYGWLASRPLRTRRLDLGQDAVCLLPSILLLSACPSNPSQQNSNVGKGEIKREVEDAKPDSPNFQQEPRYRAHIKCNLCLGGAAVEVTVSPQQQ